MKKLRLLFVFFVIIALLCVDAFLIEPNSLRVRYEVISSSKIPASLNNYTILFFSDVHYNHYTTKQRVQKVVNTINEIDANTVVFLGDLYDHPTLYEVTPAIQNELGEELAKINAKYGRFAVLGNHDYDSPATTKQVLQTLNYANFEVLINTNKALYYGGLDYVNLIAVDSLLLGNPDLDRAFKGISADDFNIIITHCPDIYDDLNTNLSDLVMTGHSHGGQIKLPFLENYFRPNGALRYFTGIHQANNVLLDISNGIGNTQINVRFNAPAEIVVYRLVTLE